MLAAETVRSENFRGLRHLANRLGDRFRAGIVLYAGEQQLSFGDRLTALPMAAPVDTRQLGVLIYHYCP